MFINIQIGDTLWIIKMVLNEQIYDIGFMNGLISFVQLRSLVNK